MNISKIFSLLFVVLPILDIYMVPIVNISLGIILSIFTIFIAIILNARKATHDILKLDLLKLHWLYCFVITCVTAVYITDLQFNTVFLRFSYFTFWYVFLYVIGKRYFNINYFWKSYTIVASIVAIIVFVQYIAFLVLGVRLIPIMNILPLNYSFDFDQLKSTILLRTFYRPTSIFLEPTHVATYLIPGVIISLFDKQRANVKLVWFWSCAVLFTFSLKGVAILIILGMLSMIKSGEIAQLVRRLAIFLGISLCVYLFAYDYFELLILQRIESFSSVSADASNMVRTSRGYLYFSEFSIFQIIFGVGPCFIGEYLTMLGSRLYLTAIDQKYMNSMSYIMCIGGILGTLMFLGWYVRLYLSSVYLSKVILLVLFCLFLSSSIFNTFEYILLLAIVYDTNFRKMQI